MVIAPLHLPNPNTVSNIMCAMYRYRYDVELHILYFPKNVFFYGALSPGVHVHTPFWVFLLGFDPSNPKYMYGCLNQWLNLNYPWVRWVPSYCIWDQHIRYWHHTMSISFVTCVFLAILCLSYCSPPHHTTNTRKYFKYYWCDMITCIYGRCLGVQTMGQLLFLMLW